MIYVAIIVESAFFVKIPSRELTEPTDLAELPKVAKLSKVTKLSELTKLNELYQLVSRFKVSEVPDLLVWWSKKVEKMNSFKTR